MGPSTSITWSKPVILVTNEDPTTWPEALVTRLHPIECIEPIVQLIDQYCSDNPHVPREQFNEESVDIPVQLVQPIDQGLKRAIEFSQNSGYEYDEDLVLPPQFDCIKDHYPQQTDHTPEVRQPHAAVTVSTSQVRGRRTRGTPTHQPLNRYTPSDVDLLEAGPSNRPITTHSSTPNLSTSNQSQLPMTPSNQSPSHTPTSIRTSTLRSTSVTVRRSPTNYQSSPKDPTIKS